MFTQANYNDEIVRRKLNALLAEVKSATVAELDAMLMAAGYEHYSQIEDEVVPRLVEFFKPDRWNEYETFDLLVDLDDNSDLADLGRYSGIIQLARAFAICKTGSVHSLEFDQKRERTRPVRVFIGGDQSGDLEALVTYHNIGKLSVLLDPAVECR